MFKAIRGEKMKYYFTGFDRIVDFLLKKNILRCSIPTINYLDDGEYFKFEITIEGKKSTFYVKKDGLKEYELRAAYKETFCDRRINGHAYIRKEVPINIGDIVLDAGGCEGFFTRYALNKGAGKVIVVEPCGKLADGICKSFQEEIVAGKVIVVRKALGRSKGEQTLVIDEDMYCSSNVGYLSTPINKKEEKISVDCLDHIMAELSLKKLDLIKMDIEGAEMDALIGAENVIRCHRPKMLIATYHGYINAMECKNIVLSIHNDYKSKFCGYYTYKKPYRPYLTLFY